MPDSFFAFSVRTAMRIVFPQNKKQIDGYKVKDPLNTEQARCNSQRTLKKVLFKQT